VDDRRVPPFGTVETAKNRLANSAPLDNLSDRDGKYVCIVAGSTPLRALCTAMEHDLVTDAHFARWPIAPHAATDHGIVAD